MPVLLEESSIYDLYDVYLNQIIGNSFKYQEFHNKLKQLPDNILDFILSTVPGDFIKDRISIPLGLNENQSKEIAVIVLELILTDIYLGNVVNEVKSRLQVDEMKAKTIAGLLVTQLFSPILDDLKKMHIEKFTKNLPKPNQEIDDRVVNLKNF